MRDIHAEAPRAGLTLDRVGIRGIARPLAIQRPDRAVPLLARFELTVDLPAARKGSDLSRNAELLGDVLEDALERPVDSLEAACARLAGELLARHGYANRSSARAEADYLRPPTNPTGHPSLEEYRIFAESVGTRTPSGTPRVSRVIGGEAVGTTACPCAMETARELLSEEFPELREPRFATLPIVTHNQRNRTRLSLELPEGAEVELDAILDAIESAQSAPTYAVLKRRAEAEIVLRAHRNPKFVEDVVRDLLVSLPERFPGLPDATRAKVETASEESIHKYDVVASHQATFGALRALARS